VGKGAEEYRVYVHPATAQVLYSVNDRARPFSRIFYLHGELLAGDKGSLLIELAGSWTIIMILTGLMLWWPRNGMRLAGVLYPRPHLKGRLWWRPPFRDRRLGIVPGIGAAVHGPSVG
jgi:uncharacterized iron-regulated membrane protein